MEQTEHQLSPDEKNLLGEYDSAIRGLFVKYAEAICDLNAQKLGVIHCMIRHAGLEGTWNLDLDRGKLVRTSQEATQGDPRDERLSQIGDVLAAISDCVNHAAMGVAPSSNPIAAPDGRGDAGFAKDVGISWD